MRSDSRRLKAGLLTEGQQLSPRTGREGAHDVRKSGMSPFVEGKGRPRPMGSGALLLRVVTRPRAKNTLR